MNDILHSLDAVSRLWLDRQNPLREETIQALQVSTGFSRRQIELSLNNCFEELTLPKITAYSRDLGQSPASGLKQVLHILPSNAFTAWIHGAVITLLLGYRCLLKPSAREPVFSRSWKKSLENVDRALGDQVDLISWDKKVMKKADAVVAYGSDETLNILRSEVPEYVPFIGYGHKLSVGVMFKEALIEGFSEQLLECVRYDAEPFRLQGCLSPQILYVESAYLSRWPALETAVDVSPKIKPFTEWEAVRSDLAKFSPYLSCIGYAGLPEKAQFLENELWDLNVSRVCPLGEMQRPPLTWRNGGYCLPELLRGEIAAVKDKLVDGI